MVGYFHMKSLYPLWYTLLARCSHSPIVDFVKSSTRDVWISSRLVCQEIHVKTTLPVETFLSLPQGDVWISDENNSLPRSCWLIYHIKYGDFKEADGSLTWCITLSWQQYPLPIWIINWQGIWLPAECNASSYTQLAAISLADLNHKFKIFIN